MQRKLFSYFPSTKDKPKQEKEDNTNATDVTKDVVHNRKRKRSSIENSNITDVCSKDKPISEDINNVNNANVNKRRKANTNNTNANLKANNNKDKTNTIGNKDEDDKLEKEANVNTNDDKIVDTNITNSEDNKDDKKGVKKKEEHEAKQKETETQIEKEKEKEKEKENTIELKSDAYYDFEKDGHLPHILGIDEAGRGPVLGPMVYAAAYFPLQQNPLLKKLGFADSKALTEEERERLFKVVRDKRVGFLADVISPEELSHKMLKRVKVSLNKISHESAIQLIKDVLAKGVNVTDVYVDTVGPPEKYQNYLKTVFPFIKNIVVSKKADAIYPIVGAASICAKVIRDFKLKNWHFNETNGASLSALGSGYPGDPKTKTWLRENIDNVFGFPSIVRFSWKTCSNLLAESAASVDWFEEPKKNTITFAAPIKTKDTRNIFFACRDLQHVTNL